MEYGAEGWLWALFGAPQLPAASSASRSAPGQKSQERRSAGGRRPATRWGEANDMALIRPVADRCAT